MRVQRRNDLSLRLLEIFGTLMLHRTTVDTATELGVSQPAVSLAIKELEKQVGFALFERVKQRLHPTDEARSLFAEIEPLLGMMRSIESHVRDLRDGTEGKLRLMSTPPLGNAVIPAALKRFVTARPNVSVAYDVGRLDDVLESVESGSVELGLVLALEQHPAVHVRHLDRYRMVALVPSSHPLHRRGESVTPGDAAEHGFVGLDRQSRLGVMVEATFARMQVAHEPRVVVRNCHTAAVLADAGMGLAIVDPFTAGFVKDLDLVACPFEPAMEIPACLLTRTGTTPSRIAETFVGELEGVLADRGMPVAVARTA